MLPAESVRADSVLARPVAVADVAAFTAVGGVRLQVEAAAVGRAQGESRRAHALPIRADLGGLIAHGSTGPTVERIVGDGLTTVATVHSSGRALARAAGAFGTVGADRVAVSAVLVVRTNVEAPVGTHLVELSVEQARIADALTFLALRVDAAYDPATAAVVVVPQNTDTAVAAVESVGGASTSAADALTFAAAVPVGTRVTQKSTARVAIAGPAAAVVRIAPRADGARNQARRGSAPAARSAAAAGCAARARRGAAP